MQSTCYLLKNFEAHEWNTKCILQPLFRSWRTLQENKRENKTFKNLVQLIAENAVKLKGSRQLQLNSKVCIMCFDLFLVREWIV